MDEDTPSSTLVIRAGDRSIHPSSDDTEEIQQAVAAVTEIFQSLLRIAADDQTTAALLSAANGESLGPTPGDVQEITQKLHVVLSALPGTELNFDNLKAIQSELDMHAETMRQSFEARSEQFTSRPVAEAAALHVTGALFAGLSDAAGALNQLLGLLEQVANQSGEAHGGP